MCATLAPSCIAAAAVDRTDGAQGCTDGAPVTLLSLMLLAVLALVEDTFFLRIRVVGVNDATVLATETLSAVVMCCMGGRDDIGLCVMCCRRSAVGKLDVCTARDAVRVWDAKDQG